LWFLIYTTFACNHWPADDSEASFTAFNRVLDVARLTALLTISLLLIDFVAAWKTKAQWLMRRGFVNAAAILVQLLVLDGIGFIRWMSGIHRSL